jgi:hypothetical protein
MFGYAPNLARQRECQLLINLSPHDCVGNLFELRVYTHIDACHMQQI